MYSEVRCTKSSTYLDVSVQQGALLQALVQQTHLFDSVAADAVGVVVDAEQQAAQQDGKFKTCGSLSLQHRGGGEQVPGLGQQHTHLHYHSHTLKRSCVCVVMDGYLSTYTRINGNTITT